jgi:hypothetical protein
MLGIANTDAGDGESDAAADASVLTENAEMRLKGDGRREIYAWADRLLERQDYRHLPEPARVWCDAT